jgi:anti-anti-sigma factor
MGIFDAAYPSDGDDQLAAARRLYVDHALTTDSAEVRIWVRGELDIATHDDLCAGLSKIKRSDLDGAAAVRLDLSGLTFCDARGGNLLLRLVEQATRRDRAVSIEHPTPAVRRVLELINPSLDLVASRPATATARPGRIFPRTWTSGRSNRDPQTRRLLARTSVCGLYG